ncbi:MAG: septum site-determining protein MinC [Candidatus Thiodiazotropha sp.]
MITTGTQSLSATTPGAELKAGTFTLPTLCLSGLELEAIDELLHAKVAKAPHFFRNTPVVLDLTHSAEGYDNADLAIAIGAVRGYGLVPIGVRGGSKEQREQARLLELAVFPQSQRSKPSKAPVRHMAQAAPTRIVDTPVRSGQRVYAKGGDLVLLAPVSSGAEVVADGHVHAYAPIRGRVLAGVLGDSSACIFCKDLNAELVSIAGRYKVNEDLEPGYTGRFVAVSLKGDALIFKKL